MQDEKVSDCHNDIKVLLTGLLRQFQDHFPQLISDGLLNPAMATSPQMFANLFDDWTYKYYPRGNYFVKCNKKFKNISYIFRFLYFN